MSRALMLGSAVAALVAGNVEAFAASPQEDLVERWLKGTSFGLEVSIGSSRFDPASQSVVMENVQIGRDGDLMRLTYPGLTVEDPRLTPEGHFAAHAVRIENLGGDVTFDLKRWFPDFAAAAEAQEKAEAAAGTDGADAAGGSDAGAAPEQPADGGARDGIAGADQPPADGGVEAEVEIDPTKPFDVTLQAETVLYERLVMPMETPNLSRIESTFDKILALTRWSTTVRADWVEYGNMRSETKGSPDGDFVTTYGQQYAAGLHDGRIERAGYSGMSQVPAEGNSSAPVKSYSIGSGWLMGLDFEAYLQVLDPAAYAGGKGDGVWRTVLLQNGANDVSVEFDGGAFTIQSAEMNGFRLRQTEKPLLEVVKRMLADPKALEEDPLPYVADLLPAISGMWGVDSAVMWNLESSFGADTSFKMERADLNRLDADGMGALTLRGMEAQTPEGKAALGFFTLNNMTFGNLMSWVELGASADANPNGEPDPAAVKKAMLEGSPTIDFLELNNLSFETLMGTINLNTFALTESDFLQALARRYDFTFTGLNFPVSMIPEPEAQQQLTDMGYETFDISGATTFTWDTEKGDVRMLDTTVKLTDMGTLSGDLHLGNLPLSIFDDPAAIEQRMQQGTLVGASLTFGNQSIVERTFEAQAKKLNQPAEDFRKNFANAMPFMLGFLEDKTLQTRFATVLQAFFADPKSLVITVKPAAPVPFEVLETIETEAPGEVLDLLKVQFEANK